MHSSPARASVDATRTQVENGTHSLSELWRARRALRGRASVKPYVES
jgi:hypothetical protein